MSYIQSLRFKLMLLCIIPLLLCAFLFIGHSVLIAFQLRDIASDTYLTAVQEAGATEAVSQAIQKASLEMGWIGKQWAIVFGILFVCFYVPITINIAKFIKPIRQLAKASDNLTKGDINIQVTKNRTDEIGILQSSFQELINASREQAELIRNIADGDISGEYIPRSDVDVVGNSLVKMLEGNNEMIFNLAIATHQISTVSRQIADGSQSLANSSSQQATAIESLTSMVRDVAKIPHESLQLAQKATSFAETAKDNAENGNSQMNNMIIAVNEIRDASLGIQKIMKVIDDIAFQTNILALNASVEAARAGQHGKGFAVVAEEVRNLAAKSAAAAKDTGSLIVSSMEKTSLGVCMVSESSASIEGIVEDIAKSSEIIHEIAALSGNQDVSIAGISENLNQMANVVNSNSAMAEEYAASSEEMNMQVGMMLDIVSRFKLNSALAKTHSSLSLT